MKKNLLLWAVCAVMMAFTACTQEKVVYVEEEKNDMNLQPGEGIIEISLAGAMSRAARPIDHFNPTDPYGNNVNRIGFRVYRFADEGLGYTTDDNVKILEVDGKMVTTGEETTAKPLNDYVIKTSGLTNSSSVMIKIKIDGEVHSPYHIVAYGYNCANENDTDFPYLNSNNELENQTETHEPSGDETEPTVETLVGLQCDMSDESFPEEIFAGKIEAQVNEYGLFVAENILTLDRQVAGMLVYLGGVPSYVANEKVAKVTISTIMDVTVLKFPSEATNNGIAPNNFGKTDLLTFQFKDNKAVTNYNTVSSNGGDYIFSRKVDPDDEESDTKKYLLPTEMDADVIQYLDENIECKSNTLFGSCFLLPFPSTNTSYDFSNNKGTDVWNALNIVYWDEDGNIIKVVPLTDSNTGNTGGYSIERNHFYSIGTKKSADLPEGTDDPDDKPLDIGEETGFDNYVVKINDAWDGNFSLTNK